VGGAGSAVTYFEESVEFLLKLSAADLEVKILQVLLPFIQCVILPCQLYFFLYSSPVDNAYAFCFT
jgi:hypothetical protein